MSEGRTSITPFAVRANAISSALTPLQTFHYTTAETAQQSHSRRLADSNCWLIPLLFAYLSQKFGQARASTDIVTPEVGLRLASLADGEGCFVLSRQHKNGRTTHQCSFVVKMRADDLPFLKLFQRATGLGRVYRHKASADATRSNSPSASWTVQSSAECLALVEIFERYPLWSKKARDLAVWARAVRYWTAPALLPRSGKGRQTFVDQAPLASLHRDLADLRRFVA